VVEFEVVALPGLGIGAVAGEQALLDRRELVIGGDHPPLPVHVAGLERLGQRVRLEQQPQRRELAQIFRRDRRDLEAALAFGHHQPFGGQAAQQLAQRRDARPVVLAQPLELEFLGRRQFAEDDVKANPPVGLLADRIVVRGSRQHGLGKSQVFGGAPADATHPSALARRRHATAVSHIKCKISYEMQFAY
jgi:hypothetical protein